MLARTYLPHILHGIFGVGFLAVGILTFGNALLFDRIFIGALVFTLIVCFANVNVVGVVAILLLQRGIEEVTWIGLSDEPLIKAVLYLISFLVSYKLRDDAAAKILMVVCVLAVGTELYWGMTGYHAPEIYWYVNMVAIAVLVRELVFSRVFYTKIFTSRTATSINLDWQIYKLNFVAIVIQSSIMVEYVLRHLLGRFDWIFFYQMTPYAMHALGTYALWVTFSENYKLLINRLIHA